MYDKLLMSDIPAGVAATQAANRRSIMHAAS